MCNGQDPPGSGDHLQPNAQQGQPFLASQQATSAAEAQLTHHPAAGYPGATAEAAPAGCTASVAGDRLPDGRPSSQAGNLTWPAELRGSPHEPSMAGLEAGPSGAQVEAEGAVPQSSPDSGLPGPAAPMAALAESPTSAVQGGPVKLQPADNIKVAPPTHPKPEYTYQAEHIEVPPKKRSRLSRSSAAHGDGGDQQPELGFAPEVGLHDEPVVVEERPKGKRPVAAAVFCAFGAGLAQLPFIATQLGERRRGHARSLCNAVSTPFVLPDTSSVVSGLYGIQKQARHRVLTSWVYEKPLW